MLFLVFQLGFDRYAIEARRVIKVLPLLSLRRLSHADGGAPAPGVAGLFRYSGEFIPALDLAELATGHPARERFSTRIILINHPQSAVDQESQLGTRTISPGLTLFGLIAERATEMIRRDWKAFVDAGVTQSKQTWLGPVLVDDDGVIQLIREQHLPVWQCRTAQETGLQRGAPTFKGQQSKRLERPSTPQPPA